MADGTELEIASNFTVRLLPTPSFAAERLGTRVRDPLRCRLTRNPLGHRAVIGLAFLLARLSRLEAWSEPCSRCHLLLAPPCGRRKLGSLKCGKSCARVCPTRVRTPARRTPTAHRKFWNVVCVRLPDASKVLECWTHQHCCTRRTKFAECPLRSFCKQTAQYARDAIPIHHGSNTLSMFSGISSAISALFGWRASK